jgi:heme exporter protein CcmD
MLNDFAGHYGTYVIPAWGISAGVLIWMVVDSLLRARRWRKAAEQHSDPDDK